MTFWEFLSNVFTRIIERFSERAFFGFLIVGAFVLSMGTLAHVELPGDETGTKNAELFGQGLVALIGAIGIIVGAIWKTSPSERIDRETINTLANKQPPVTGEARESAKETADDPASRTALYPCEGCPARPHDHGTVNADSPTGRPHIPDSIPGL